MGKQATAWVTHALDDNEVVEALVLARSFRRVLTNRALVAVVDPQLSPDLRDLLDGEFDFVFTLDHRVKSVKGLTENDMGKFFAVSLHSFRRVVYLPPTCLVLRNCDEIFSMKGSLGIIPRNDQNENKNDSVIFFSPSVEYFRAMRKDLQKTGLNGSGFERFFKNWMTNKNPEQIVAIDQKFCSSLLLVEAKGTKRFQQDAKVVRFEYMPGDVTKWGLLQKLRDIELHSTFEATYWLDIYKQEVQPLMELQTNIPSPIKGFLPPKVSYQKEPIAIVGMSCRHPASNTLDEFWNLLAEGREAVRTPPDHRWTKEQSLFNHADFRKTQAGFLDVPVDEFDAKFFGISPKEVVFLDPQHRLLHEIVWEALEDALIDPTSLQGTPGGVFMGTWRNDYVDILQRSASMEFYRGYMGNSIGAGGARISHLLGLTGPSISTESGCSAAMVAVHMACRSLQNGESNLALACGINLLLHPFKNEIMPMVTSPEGRCKTFDAGADGFGRAEGCAVLVLKRLSDAAKDGDRIWGLIRGSAIAQEGQSKSMGTPTIKCEAQAMQLALDDADVHPSQVTYVETHGTGTVVGDPMEVAAIQKVYSVGRKEPLIIGSVKTNVGHTESCSGITGIMKVILSMKNELIPAHRNFKTLNPDIDLDSVPAKLPLEPVSWPKVWGIPRIAGVSSFGITGTDAHVIVEEAPECSNGLEALKLGLSQNDRPLHIMKITARSEESLDILLERYKSLMKDEKLAEAEFSDIAYTANIGRASFNQRAILISSNKEEAYQAFESSILRKECPEDVGKICFLFTGQGSQYHGMAKNLYENCPVFSTNFDRCEKLLKEIYNISIADTFWSAEPSTTVNRTLFSQTGIFVVEYCLLKLWESWGIKPDYVLGHSLGEFAAAVCAGILTLEDAITLVAERSRLIDQLPRGSMLVIKADKSNVDNQLSNFLRDQEGKWLDYAALNSNEQTVVAGDTKVVEEFTAYLKGRGMKASMLQSTHAFHSRHMEPMLAEYRRIAQKIKYSKPIAGCKYVSGMLGKILGEDETLDADYWVKHTREKVQFLEASQAVYNDGGCRVFLELGPHPVLLALTMFNNDGKQMLCVPSLRRGEAEWRTLLDCIGKLFLNGVEINWKSFDEHYQRKKITLPHYPFQRKRYWPDIVSSVGTQIHPLLGSFLSNPTSSKLFQSALSIRSLEYLKDHMIGSSVVFPGAGFLEMILVAGHVAIEGCTEELVKPRRPIELSNMRIENPMGLNEESSSVCQVVVDFNDKVEDDSNWEGLRIKVYHQQQNDSTHNGEGGALKWISHASGNILPGVGNSTINNHLDLEVDGEQLEVGSRSWLDEKIATFAKDQVTSKFYDKLGEIGLKFGPSFRTLESVWRGKDELIAEVKVPEDSRSYLLHPTLIDAMIQAIMVNNYYGESQQQTRLKKRLYVPIGVDKFTWNSELDTEKCYIYCDKRSTETSSGSKRKPYAILMTEDGKLVAFMSGMEFAETSVKSIQSLLDQQVNCMPDTWEEIFKPTLGPLQHRSILNPDSRWEISYEAYNYVDENGKQRIALSDKLVYYLIINTFDELGWKPEVGAKITLQQFMTDHSISKQHEGIIRHFLMILQEESILECNQKVENEWIISKIPPGKYEVMEYVNGLRNCSSSDGVDFNLIIAVGDVLDQILKGKESALNIMFPKDTNKPSAEHFYERVFLDCKYAAQDSLNKTIHEMIKGNTKLAHARVLEVGAGTGCFTESVLESLESRRSDILHYEYTYTDLSPAFFNLADKKFEKYKDFMKYKKLNVEEDPSSQGFPPVYYDMVCAFEVIHATRNVRESMSNIRSMLRDGGKAYITETVSPFRKVHFLFGLLEGYWRFQDRDLRPYDATMSLKQWEQVFWETGFTNVRSFHFHNNKFGCVEGVAKPNLPLYPMVFSSPDQKLPTWLIFLNNCQLSNGLVEKFNQLQRKYVVLIKKSLSSFFLKRNESSLGCEVEINPTSQQDMAQVFQLCQDRRVNIEGILFGWGMLEQGNVHEDQALIAQPFLYVLQEMFHLPQKFPPKIVVISKGVSAVGDIATPSPSGSTLIGMCKSLIHETSNVHIKLIDINPNEVGKAFQAEEVFQEIFLEVDSSVSVAYREHNRYIPKLQKVKLQNKDLSLPNGTDRFQLVLPATRSIEDLEFGPLEPFNLKGDEVEIEVKVSALNFKDILNILKPTEEFETSNAVGFDFAGVVKSIGAEVTNLQVGNLVFGVNLNGNGLPSHIKLPSKAVAPVPDCFTLAEAACFPAVFSTAYYCLVNIAKIRKGETILLHTASGGVGLCAIQLAQYYGLNIIATAGNERKRAYLRSLGIQHVFHSRNTDYGQQILDVTDGRGVDIVLNSLTSPGFKEATLKACAKNARFIEMSKLNIWTEVEVQGLRSDVEYTIVDLTKLDESTSQHLLREMDTFAKQGIIKPIPYVRFDAVNIRQALTFLQKAKHIGKVVCTMPEVKFDGGHFKTSTPMFNDRSTYLITGGLGGIGLEVAKWMTSSGAKHIVLVSRNPPGEAVQLTINRLISKGSNIVVYNADVGDLDQCGRLVKSIQENESLPPLRGIMHAAGTLCDGFIQNQSWENFEKTYKAKVNGSWNLHELTLGLPLEHFVLYSSITGVFGSPGQSNHTSGNCFEDSLAHFRYTHGLCATTINWGQWGQVGIAVEYDLPGIAPLTTQQGINGLESIMKSQRVQVVVTNVESFSLLFKTFSHLKNYVDERAWKSEFSTGRSFNIKSEEFWEEYDACGEDRDGKVVVIKKYITISLRHILRLDATDPVDENMELQDMGVDSLMMLEMKNSLQSMFGERVTVTPASLKDCSTVNKLGERLVQIIEEEGEFTSKAPPSLDEIRELIKEDTVLPEDITPAENAGPPVLPTKIKCILVTGATGSLGSYLLSELLRTCPQLDRIYCLIRGKAGLSPKERLESTLERKCISIGDSVEKIICIEGNLTQSKFGMTDYDYTELSREVEAILHCGAKISHLEFYRKIEGSLHDIRTINVKGLLNVLEFAVKHRIKHVFNTSTVMTVMKIDEDGRMLETWPDAEAFDNISNRGYPVSKHVCDVLLKQAVERGVPCKSFKYPEICGGTNSSSSFNFESRHYMLVHMYMMKEGIMPTVPFPCNVIPVDIAAKITLQICFNHDDAENEMYLVQNPSPQMTQAFFPELAKEFGFPIEIVEYEQFITRIIEQGENSFLYHFRDLYKDEKQFVQGIASTPQHEAARKYLENTDDMFVCKKLMRMVPELVKGIESSYEIMKRDLAMAQKEGYFEKFGMVKKTEE